MGNKLIKPFFRLKLNQCPKCFEKLELVENETYVGALDSVGIPIGGQSFIDVSLRCTKCYSEYPAMKKGAHYAIKVTDEMPVKIVKEFNPFYN